MSQVNTRPRILALTESCHLSTGYGVISKEILSRLHADGFDIFELASFGGKNPGVPWKYWGVLPESDKERSIYDASPMNVYGAWRFEAACLHHKPDVVWTYRDPFMCSYVGESPFRPYFTWVNQTTVDAAPQDEDWILSMSQADLVTTYTHWGNELLQKHLGAKLIEPMGLGVDFNTFKPVADRKVHRENMGLDPDCNIIGAVYRNQTRKLIPDLLEAFATFLRVAPEPIRTNTYLYLHTAWPDLGWNIPRLLKETGVGSRVLFTYSCKTKGCGQVFPSFYADVRTVCRACGNPNASMVTVNQGVPPEILAGIYNLMDVYVQLHKAEGFGIPVVEAAACGVPSIVSDYAGTTDFVRFLGALPVPSQGFAREVETHRKMAVPSQPCLVSKLIEYLRLPSPIKKVESEEVFQKAKKLYNWDAIASKWAEYFSACPRGNWGVPSSQHSIPKESPNLPNDDFVRWGFSVMAGRPDLAHSHLAARVLRDLNWGMTINSMTGSFQTDMSKNNSQPKFSEFTRQDCINLWTRMGEVKNDWERRRLEQIKPQERVDG